MSECSLADRLSDDQPGRKTLTATITAFESSPDRGQGLARDMRVRWALEEVGQPYEVRLASFAALKAPAHLALHPFGQIPTFEDGDILLVDTGIRDPKIIDGVYVMAANDRVYIKRVRQRMGRFDGGQNAFSRATLRQHRQRVVVIHRFVLHAVDAREQRVLGTDTGIVETGRHRMRFLNLAVLVL